MRTKEQVKPYVIKLFAKTNYYSILLMFAAGRSLLTHFILHDCQLES